MSRLCRPAEERRSRASERTSGADATASRTRVYSERFKPNGFGPYTIHVRMARDDRYKLVRDLVAKKDLLFDLKEDPDELAPLDLDDLSEEVAAA